METVTTMVTENFESPALESLPFEELCYDDDPGFPKSDISKLIQANLAVSFYFIIIDCNSFSLLIPYARMQQVA